MNTQLLFNFDVPCSPLRVDSGRVSLLCKKTTSTPQNTLPKNLLALPTDCNLETLLNSLGLDCVISTKQTSFNVTRDYIEQGGRCSNNPLIAEINDEDFNSTIAYFDDNGKMWLTHLTIHTNNRIPTYRRISNVATANCCLSFSCNKWTNPKHKTLKTGLTFLQTKGQLTAILEKVNPYTAEWAKKMGADPQVLLMAPQVETLYKANYSFAKKLLYYGSIDETTCTYFNRLCQEGTKPKTIFKTSKAVYSVLKNEQDLQMWDCYRRLDKTGKICADNVAQAYGQGFNNHDLEKINSIMAKRYNGKPVFTWQSLVNYLGRLDTFEAIEKKEAFMLLDDYLSMCNQLQMEPRVDGDSLKREHDIAARNLRNRRNEILEQKMNKGCEKMKKFNYSENVYFVRAIESYKDLLDEANQQHNCVASYGSRIANGSSFIYVMREVTNPNRSLITIELSPNGKEIRQKFLAYNRPIHNKSQSEFIDRWLKHCRNISK